MGVTRMYWLHTLSPTHVGTGSGVGHIDLPIHRDKITGWPVIPASTFKGVWSDYHRATTEGRNTNQELRAAFGIVGEDHSNAGALIPTDARMVCFPVRSFRGTFAWTTSSIALRMLRRDLELAGVSELPEVPDPPPEDKVFLPTHSVLQDEGRRDGGDRVYLEDLDFDVLENKNATSWAEKISGWVFDDSGWQELFRARFAVIPDTVFDFISHTGTEVVTRVRIDEKTKNVIEGALWNEELLPAEAILSGLISCDRVYVNGVMENNLITKFATESITCQIGGKATVGRGRVRCVFTGV